MDLIYLVKLFFDIIIASFSGFILDEICSVLQSKYSIRPIIMTINQIVINIFLAYYLKTHLRPYFTRTWLETLRGLFFVTFFFNMQRNLYKNIELTYKSYLTLSR